MQNRGSSTGPFLRRTPSPRPGLKPIPS
jgi:hypothetical protein